MADDLAGFASDLRAVADDLDGPAMVRTLEDAGTEADSLAAGAVRRDLGGDGRMSRWPKARFDVHSVVMNPTWLEIAPTPKSRGPMHVAEFGRKAGMSRPRKGRPARKVSSSRGLSTWTDVGVELEKLGPIIEVSVDKIMDRLR